MFCPECWQREFDGARQGSHNGIRGAGGCPVARSSSSERVTLLVRRRSTFPCGLAVANRIMGSRLRVREQSTVRATASGHPVASDTLSSPTPPVVPPPASRPVATVVPAAACSSFQAPVRTRPTVEHDGGSCRRPAASMGRAFKRQPGHFVSFWSKAGCGPAQRRASGSQIGPKGRSVTRVGRGSTGVRGSKGRMGPLARPGLAGAAGPQGPEGPSGSQGSPGAVGPTGPAGPGGLRGRSVRPAPRVRKAARR